MAELDILIPHFNDPDGLALSLQSIALQTWKGESRIVIADDGSAPDHFAKLESVIESHPRPVTLLRNSQNRGRPYTRNVLLDALESPYAAWLDAGDEWCANKIEAQFADLKRAERKNQSIWVSCHFEERRGSERKIHRQRIDHDPVRGLLSGETVAYLWTLLAPSQTFRDVGRFDERLPWAEDLDFFLTFVSKGGEIRLCSTDAPLCIYYRSRAKYDPDMMRACCLHTIKKHQVLYDRYGDRFTRRRLYRIEKYSAHCAAHNSMRRRQIAYYWRAFKISPPQMIWYLTRMIVKAVVRGASRHIGS